MKLHIQPDAGIAPLVKAIEKAKKSIHILIFRFDRAEIEQALVDAARRGVDVTALIAFTNRGEERNLRKLEMRFLGQGITVGRTADDLVRYHGKMMIVDEQELWVLGFNLTHLDANLSRSFSATTRKKALVKEALKLFECDMKRRPYTASCKELVVSPVNARKELKSFIEGAKKQLLIYEMKISDPEFIRQLENKRSAGVDVRIVGKVGRKGSTLEARELSNMRMHVRAMVRDGKHAFLGSLSLRKLELEARREIGIFFDDPSAVKSILQTFEKDWETSIPQKRDPNTSGIDLPAKKVARAVMKNFAVDDMVEHALEKIIDPKSTSPIAPSDVAESVHSAIKDAVREAVVEAVREIAAHPSEEAAEEEQAESTGRKKRARKAA